MESLAAIYAVDGEIGRGGMSTVLRGRLDGRAIAIKVLLPELALSLAADRFNREIAFLRVLDHPNIVPLLDSGVAGGLLYYVMPLVSGGTLRERLERGEPLPLESVCAIVRDVAAAIDAAHARNVLHRDIKPENIVFEGERALVCDFGVARAIEEAGGEVLSSSGLILGTPAYMSPEQAAGKRALTGRCDVYGLGCVVYELLGGEPPFTGPSAQAVLARHASSAPRPLQTVRPDLPKGVEAAVLAALAKMPEDRPSSAGELATMLAAAV